MLQTYTARSPHGFRSVICGWAFNAGASECSQAAVFWKLHVKLDLCGCFHELVSPAVL